MDVAAAEVPGWFCERMVDDALRGLRPYVRDAWLRPSVAALYRPGMLLRSPVPVEATSRLGGMRTSQRFTILSNHMVDVGRLFDDDDMLVRGQHAADSGSRFLVLDVYASGGKTQVLLLHLPDDERWELYPSLGSPAVRALVPALRRRFEQSRRLRVSPELDDDWLTTCHDPVGVGEDGAPFPLDVSLARRLRDLGGTDFRALAGHLVLVCGARLALGLGGRGFGDEGVLSPAFPDAVCWAYLDHERGLVLRALTAARPDGRGGYDVGDGLDGLTLELDAGEVLDRDCAAVLDRVLVERANVLDEIHAAHEAQDARLAPVRALAALDPFRSRSHPDDVRARLASERPVRPEIAWVRTEGVDADGLAWGRLLVEPSQSCGAHMGDEVRLRVRDTADGAECLALIG